MKHLLFNKIVLALAVVALFVTGMLRDPDLAQADEADHEPLAHEYLPGYQFAPDAAVSQPLTDVEIAKLNTPSDGAVPTF